MEQLPHPARENIDLAELFAALGNPRRLELVRAIADGAERDCSDLRGPTPKSTMTHHWKTLRNAGAIWQRPEGRAFRVQLRREDLEVRFPGLLDAIFNTPGS
jgi:DNA-binding transcriptional ArsR family regulator